MQRDDDGERGGGDYQVLNRQNQDRRLTDMQGENQQRQLQQPQQEQQHHPHPPPQKCPRCDSVNTKFCYYNNYSLSQPRYFCKTCRRYWTQGGTLRNVPVGGGCRKGKRAKTSSSSSNPSAENSRSQPHPEPQHGQQNQLASSQSIHFSTATGNTASALGLRTNKDLSGSVVSSPGISSMGSYYPGGGFLSSLAAIQSLNSQSTQQSFHLNQPTVNLGGDSNLGLLHAFNLVPSFGSQQQQQRQFYHMGNREAKSSSDHHSFYPQESFNIHSTSSSRPAGSTSHHHQQQQNWHRQGFVSSGAINPPVADTALWSISTSTSTGGNANNNSTNSSDPASPPLNPDDQWHGLPGYGPPP